MTNEELLSLNSGKKFDIVLMNPPYDDGITKGIKKNIHVKFTLKCLDTSHKVVCLMPIKVVKNENAKRELTEAKEIFNNTIVSVDEVPSKVFGDTKMPNVGIYYFNDNKKQNDKIQLNYFDGSYEVDSLLKGVSINEIETEILKYIECDDEHLNWNIAGYSKDLTDEERKDCCNRIVNKIFRQKRFINRNIKHPVFLFTNAANGTMNGTFISSKVGTISKNREELIDNLLKRNGAVTTILVFDSVEGAENCKVALQNNVLRLACYRNQIDQNIKSRVYKYVPNIDWSDPRTTTDEGLLELCGCPKDKCKEYADYCKEVIEKVDNK